jgi:transcriptional regulator with AAA-type ATPase domain/tetratricopeptide (TPR) repeat protein
MDPLEELLGESPGIMAVRTRLARFLSGRSTSRRMPPILITGETGAGKGLLARAVHRAGPRADGPLIDVNCAAIPETLLEAELFGYERGAFTDARQPKPGLFQTAHRGTLFLDEIGLLPFGLQAKLLKFLDEHTVRRLGSTRDEPVDVWILTATNENLRMAVEQRRFRQDLYHRLAVLTLTVPPLRERGGDILLLAERFLAQTCADYGLASKTIGVDAREALTRYGWPGNVRELHNVIERVALMTDEPIITERLLALPASDREPAGQPRRPEGPPSSVEVSRQQLAAALEKTGWNVSRTAELLGLSRNTVRARIGRFGLSPTVVEVAARKRGAGGRPVRMPAMSPAESPAPTPWARTLRWDKRRVAWLRAWLGTPGEELEPAPLQASARLEVMIDKVQSFGGHVEDVSPFGIEASFGLEPIDEPTRRATHAAVAIRQGLTAFSRRPASLPVRLAIHTSEALIVHGGETTRIDRESKRGIASAIDAIMASADPDSIVVSGTAAAFLRRRFILEPDTPGLARYQVIRHEPSVAGMSGKPARFVGRQQELGLLEARLRSAMNGEGQLVAVVGEPGVGKSRLLAEFTHGSRGQPVRVLETGSAYGTIMPYLPVVELMRRYFGVEPDDDPERVRARVGAAISRSDDGLTRLLSPLLALLGAPDREWEHLDPAERRYRMLEAVKRVLLVESAIQPLIIVVDDVQWIDSESQVLLGALVTGLPSARILLVLSYRPEYRHEWSQLGCFTQIRLDPLTPDHAAELLESLLGTDASLQTVKHRLIERTEGNPFFLEESVQALLETGALAGVRGAYRAVEAVQAIDVPLTVEDVLAARISRLADADKALLQSAAAIGFETPFTLLWSVVGLSHDSLIAGLQRLQMAELMYEQEAGAERQFVFKHALTREVAYRSLLPEARRELHARIVTVLESVDADRVSAHVDRLAHQAFQGALWPKAVIYLRRAGDIALRSAAAHEAAEYFSQALDALRHLPESRAVVEDGIDLRLRLRDALWPLLRLPEVLERLQEADDLAQGLVDERRLGWVACYLCHYCWAVGDLERALASGERALAIARRLGDSALLAETNSYRGLIQVAKGDFQQAAAALTANLGLLEQAIAAKPSEFPSRRFAQNGPVILRSFLVRCHAELGEFPEAIAVGREAIRLADAIQSPFARVAASGGLGAVYLRAGQPAKAIEVLEPGLQVCRAYMQNQWVPTVGASLGAAYVRSGRIGDGLALLEEVVEYGARLGLAASNSVWVTYLGEAYLRADRRDEALAVAHRALRLCRERTEHGYEAWAARLIAEIAASGDNPDLAEAESRYRSALVAAQERGMRPLVAHCHLGLAQLYARTGNQSEARVHESTASAEFLALGIPWPPG